MEREQRPDHLDHVEQAGADGAGLDQGEEGDRQRDHEGEQRAGPDLTGGAADRRTECREGGATRDDRHYDQREAAPVRCPRTATGRRASAGSRRSTASTPSRPSRPGGRAPDQPRVSRGKAFSSRSSASEPATRSTVTNISVTVAATEIANESRLGRRARDDLLLDIDWVRDRAQQRGCEVEVLARQPREPDHRRGRRRTGCWPAAAAVGPRGCAGCSSGRGC